MNLNKLVEKEIVNAHDNQTSQKRQIQLEGIVPITTQRLSGEDYPMKKQSLLSELLSKITPEQQEEMDNKMMKELEDKQSQESESDLKRLVGRTHHELKTLKPYFNAVWEGTKLFETRINDRAFQRGDIVTLKEIRPDGVETGRRIDAEVGFVLSDYQDSGYVTFSLLNINKNGYA